jgi:hypothetical protein
VDWNDGTGWGGSPIALGESSLPPVTKSMSRMGHPLHPLIAVLDGDLGEGDVGREGDRLASMTRGLEQRYGLGWVSDRVPGNPRSHP